MEPINVASIIDRYGKLKALRDGKWLSLWREVRAFVMPNYSDYLPEGGERGAVLLDSTAVTARSRLAAGMYNWMAPPDKRWFELKPQSDELANDEEVKDYFAEVTKIIGLAMANSNWPSILTDLLNELACGIDAIVYCEDGGTDRLLNFRRFPIEEVCFAENARREVDTLYREFEMTSLQLVQEFGSCPGVPEIAEEAADPRRKDAKRKILHAIFPRGNRDLRLADQENMPVADVYIDLKSKTVIHEGGFKELPFAVCRFERSNNESYGRGPGVNLLPDIRMLCRMRQAYILADERQADPSWLAPDGSLIDKDFNRDPGNLIMYKPTMDGSKPEIVPNAVNLGLLQRDIDAERERIKVGFFWDIFDPLGDLKQITATEAEIRNEGKMIPFAPIAGNLHNELFRRVIYRVYGIAARRGILPEIPEKLLSAPGYQVEFVSKIALSIKKIESMGWLQTEAAIANMAQTNPEILDNFDADLITREMAAANGCPPGWIRPVKERDKIRAERAQAQQQQTAAQELIEGASALGGNMGKRPEPGSPLDAVMQGQGV